MDGAGMKLLNMIRIGIADFFLHIALTIYPESYSEWLLRAIDNEYERETVISSRRHR